LGEVGLIGMRGIQELVKATLLELRTLLLSTRRQPEPVLENNMEKQ
jgi:hypothetical protein